MSTIISSGKNRTLKFTLFANVDEDQSGTVEKSITWMQTVLLVSAYDNNKKYNT